MIKNFGTGLVKIMPWLLTGLGVIGTAAMLWVGGGIIIHNIPAIHHWVTDIVTVKLQQTGAGAWFSEAGISAIFGIAAGFWVAVAVAVATKLKPAKKK